MNIQSQAFSGVVASPRGAPSWQAPTGLAGKKAPPDVAPEASASSADAAAESSPAAGGQSAAPLTPQQQAQQKQQLAQLSSRDREVRSHEQAHSAAGGNYAGAPTYSFTRGPDGQTYAVSGEVSIDVSPIANDPAATLRKMEVVQRAALAPAEPSAQDLRVAAQAQVLAAQARSELAAQQRAERVAAAAEGKAEALSREEQGEPDGQAQAEVDRQSFDLAPNLQLYRRLSQLQESPPLVDLVA